MSGARPIFVVVLAVFVLAGCGLEERFAESVGPNKGLLKVTETSLGPAPAKGLQNHLTVSPDLKRVGFKQKRKNGQERVIVDGQEGPVFDEVGTVKFSADSKRIAYWARRGQSRLIVVDGVEGPSYDDWGEMYPIFSPDSKRMAFLARRGNKVMAVIDGVEGKSYVNILTRDRPRFSPDSKRFVYVAKRDDGNEVLVLNGVEGKPYEHVSGMQFSRNSQRVLYDGYRDKACHVVVDGVEGPPYELVSLLSGGANFSPDSKRVAYLAQLEEHDSTRYVMVVDGKPGKQYDDIQYDMEIFSPDSQRFCYRARQGDKHYVVIDGKESSPYDSEPNRPYFSPDGKHIAYKAWRPGGSFIVADGVDGRQFSWITDSLSYSPDSQHLAFVADTKGGWCVVLDGKEGPVQNVGESVRAWLEFSPDSQHVACYGSQGTTMAFVVRDGVRSRRYQHVNQYGILFSPDSQRLAYWARPGGESTWRLFVDGSYTDAYDEPLCVWTSSYAHSRMPFTSNDSLTTLALRNGKIIRLDVQLLPAPSGPKTEPMHQPSQP